MNHHTHTTHSAKLVSQVLLDAVMLDAVEPAFPPSHHGEGEPKDHQHHHL